MNTDHEWFATIRIDLGDGMWSDYILSARTEEAVKGLVRDARRAWKGHGGSAVLHHGRNSPPCSRTSWPPYLTARTASASIKRLRWLPACAEAAS